MRSCRLPSRVSSVLSGSHSDTWRGHRIARDVQHRSARPRRSPSEAAQQPRPRRAGSLRLRPFASAQPMAICRRSSGPLGSGLVSRNSTLNRRSDGHPALHRRRFRNLHHILGRYLDVVMNEDQDRSRLGHAPENLAVLRHMALNVMQKDGTKGSLRGKFKRAGWEDAYLTKLISLS